MCFDYIKAFWQRIRSSQVSIGHSYNLLDVNLRKILNVETASSQRISVHEIGSTPFFHANMYIHLQVNQVHDQNSISRQNRAALLPKKSKVDLLSLLGDSGDQEYPIYMQGTTFKHVSMHKMKILCSCFLIACMFLGPTLYTLCTAVIDLDERTMTIIKSNPKQGVVSYIFKIA